jgi:hypothetical protein
MMLHRSPSTRLPTDASGWLAGLARLDPGAGRSPPCRQSRASRPITPPAWVLAQRHGMSRGTVRITRPLPVPLTILVPKYWRTLLQGSLSIVVCYTLFYISTVFALSYGVSTLHIPKDSFLVLLCVATLFMALATPVSALLADRFGRRPVLLAGSAAAALSGFLLPSLLGGGPWRVPCR